MDFLWISLDFPCISHFIGFPMKFNGFPVDFIGIPMDFIGFPVDFIGCPIDFNGFPLDFIGFQANEIQSDSTISSMKAIMTLIPSVGVALSLIIIYFYPIDAKMHKDLLRQLQEENK